MLGLNLQASYIAEREMLDVSITLSVGEFTLFYFSPQHSIWLDFSLFRQTEFSIITFLIVKIVLIIMCVIVFLI